MDILLQIFLIALYIVFVVIVPWIIIAALAAMLVSQFYGGKTLSQKQQSLLTLGVIGVIALALAIIVLDLHLGS